MLTQRADALTGTDGDDIFEAPVTQNETGSGALANTFETGDVLIGGEGNDVLRADLIDTGTIQDTINSAAISATTTGIEEVYLRAQRTNGDNEIDAEKMSGVEQWWTDNSRANITIEDIRSATEDTTFGMRETDPGVAFTNYFNALYLEGQVDSGASSFSFVIAETGNAAAELANINVFAINFEHEGEYYSLDSDAVRAADTWTELQDALQAEVDAEAALEGLTITHVGGGVFQVVDPNAGLFDIDPAGTVVTSSTTDETKDAVPGLLMPEEGPTITNVVLDGAGNGSQGGTLNIGAMSGLRGVEVFEVNVDRDSHLTSMTSFNQTPGQYNALRDGGVNEFLEVVNLTSIGAEGDLELGRTTANLDSRVALWSNAAGVATAAANSGLLNVREFNTENFNGALNVAFTLDNNAIARYLDSAEDVVTFDYNGGNQNDIFNISDISTLGVSADQDFAMDVDMGAGDDRLVINMPTSRAVSVDGGEGENSIVVSQTHGTAANNTFAAFANFQTYEVEGTGATSHDFTSMSGIENVIVATGTSNPIAAGGNTTLIDLEAAQDVTVSGKNQTIGNQSTADQNFGTITLTDDAGVDRTVTLDNTARLANTTNGVRTDGVLTVNALTINENDTVNAPSGSGVSETRNVTISSTGERNVANAVAAFTGRDVETLDLVGSQDLTFNVAQIADQAAAAGVAASTALDIDASALTGELNLAITGTMIGNWGTATGLTDTIVGTAGDNDTLMVWGAQGNDAVTVTGFETIQFGNANTTMFGDLDITAAGGAAIDAGGTFDAQNVAASSFVIADDIVSTDTALVLNNLGSGVTVALGDANRDATGAVVNGQAFNDTITLNSGAAAGTPAAEISVDYLSNLDTLNSDNTLAVNGYQTVNVNVAHAANTAAAAGDARVIDLQLDLANEDARVLNITGGDVNGTNNAGVYDTLDLNDALGVNNQLNTTLRTIDISGYEGEVTLVMDQAVLAATTQTDVTFVMSEHNADITIATGAAPLADITHNSIFVFTADKGNVNDQSVWTISGNVIGAGAGGGTIDNITRFDVSDLGITSFDQLDLASFPGIIYSEAQIDASTAGTADAATWAIDLTGAVVGTLTEDNFIFA
jgi:hypothetical protein